MADAPAPGGGGEYYPPSQPAAPAESPSHGWFADIAKSMNNFAVAAQAGKFAVDATGGKALIQWANEIKSWYADNVVALQNAAVAPKLGGSNAAKVVSPYMSQVGQDGQGYLQQMQALAQQMDKFIDTVNQAMNNYKHADEQNAGDITKSGS